MSPPRSDLEWMRLQAAALHDLDADGRIVRFRDPTGSTEATPIVFLGRTAVGNVWAIRSDVPEDLADALQGLLAREPASNDAAPPRSAASISRCVEGFSAITEVWSGPALRFCEVPPPTGGPQSIRVIGEADVPRVEASFPQLRGSLDARAPAVALLEAGRVLSVAHAATAPGPALEVAVDTVPEARGRGFAARVVAAWADEVRRTGRIPLYSTRWDNGPSLAVARKLGLLRYGTDWHLR